MNELKVFTRRIENFSTLGAGDQIKYFVYFLQTEKSAEFVKPKDVAECFDLLHINQYSNISRYLKDNSKKRSKKQQFLIKDGGYILYSPIREMIDAELGKPVEIRGSNSLYSLSIFDNTKPYLVAFSKEASSCYDLGFYNSCLLMLRKIMETLIIELYESKNLEAKIKTSGGDYYQLKALISAVTAEPSWKLSKTTRENLPKLKLYADSSAHSRRFNAKKDDVDGLKDNVRIIFEELVHLIDYSTYK